MISGLFTHYERDSFLRYLNPTLKLGLVLLFMLVATLLFDVWSLLAIALLALIATWRLGRVPLSAIFRGSVPFLLLGVGYLWMNILFPRADGESVTVLLRIGPFRIVQEGVGNGLALLARALCMGACSLFFVTSTDPTDFILSLIQQLRVSPRLAYGALGAYRFVPLLEDEWAQIRKAHWLRGVGKGDGLRGKVTQLYRYTIPLLASGVRKAGRTAWAMESRAFTGDRDRSYYRELVITRADWLFAIGALIALMLILFVAWRFGSLQLWRGSLGF